MVGETTESWEQTVETALRLAPDSLTIYQMELPYNTVFVKSSKDNGEATPVADWPTKRAWVDWAFNRFVEAGYSISSAYTLVRDPSEVEFRYRDMLWEGSDLIALGVASFGHLSGIHYQNKTHWDDYLGAIDAHQLPGVAVWLQSRENYLFGNWYLVLKRALLIRSGSPASLVSIQSSNGHLHGVSCLVKGFWSPSKQQTPLNLHEGDCFRWTPFSAAFSIKPNNREHWVLTVKNGFQVTDPLVQATQPVCLGKNPACMVSRPFASAFLTLRFLGVCGYC